MKGHAAHICYWFALEWTLYVVDVSQMFTLTSLFERHSNREVNSNILSWSSWSWKYQTWT